MEVRLLITSRRACACGPELSIRSVFGGFSSVLYGKVLPSHFGTDRDQAVPTTGESPNDQRS